MELVVGSSGRLAPLPEQLIYGMAKPRYVASSNPDVEQDVLLLDLLGDARQQLKHT